MAFNIEQMKADGVSAHLIELASMEQETLLLLTARRLEHDKLFQQFMGENAGSIETMYPYAVAAGLMSERDREWLIDEENPYKPQTYRVTFDKTEISTEGNISDYIDVNIGESIILPGHDQIFWHTTNDFTTTTNLIGYGGQSYTPTENITLYGILQQEI